VALGRPIHPSWRRLARPRHGVSFPFGIFSGLPRNQGGIDNNIWGDGQTEASATCRQCFPVFGRSVREPTKIMAAHSFVEEAAPSCFAAAWVCLLGSKLSSTQEHSRTQRIHY
jgi:hypothetical protein